MAGNIRVDGSMIRCMARGSSSGLGVKAMWAAMRKILNMDMAGWTMETAESTRVIGAMVNSKEKGKFWTNQDEWRPATGRTESL